MKIRSALLAVIILIFVFATVERVNAAKARTESKTAITISMDTKKLPKKFVGDNEKIAAIINASYFEKDEYETKAAYEQRKKSLENKVYVFSHNLDEYENETVYNAEESVLIITLSPLMPKSIYKSMNNLKDSYIGQNAFGARTKVRAGTIYDYRIQYELPDCKLDFKMKPEEAELFRESIRVLCWVKIFNVDSSTSYHDATYNIPLDSKHISYTGKASIVEIWLYNFKTGEIYKKLTSDGKPINF